MTAEVKVNASVTATGDEAAAKLKALASNVADAKIELQRAKAEAKALDAEIKALNKSTDSAGKVTADYHNRLRDLTAQETLAADAARKAQVAFDAQARGVTAVHAANGQARASTAQLGQQIGDITQGMAAGTPVATIFAQQAGQVAFALQGMGGVAGTVGTYLSGPWGALMLGAVTILGTMATAYFNVEDSSKKAADGLDEFQKSQSDIGKFIDATTGKLTEQNRILVQNAILTRKKAIEENQAKINAAGGAASAAVERVAKTGTRFIAERHADAPVYDPAIMSAFAASTHDGVLNIVKLKEGFEALAKQRPELEGTLKVIIAQGAAAVDLTKKNAALEAEIGQLEGKNVGATKSTASLIEKQVALATATTALERARAKYAIVQTEGAGIDKAGTAAQEAYRVKLTEAANAVNAAEAAERSVREGRKATTSATIAATKATRDLARAEADRAKLITGIGDDIDKFFAEQIADVRALENRYDPLTAAARDYREEMERIKGLEVSGAITAAQAGTFRAGVAADAAKPTKDVADAYAAAKKQADELDQANARRYEYLANTFYDAFNGRTGDIWSKFKDMGLRTIAELAAQFVLTGQINFGATSAGGIVSSLLGGGSGGGGLLGSAGGISGIATKVGGLLGIGGGAAAGAGLLSAGAGVGLAASAGTAALAGGAGLLGAGGAAIGGSLALGGGALATGGLAAASGVGLASAAGVGGAAIAGGTAAAGGLAAAAAPLLAAAPYIAAALAAGLLIKSLIKKDDWGDASLTTTAAGVSITGQRTHGSGRAATGNSLADAVSAGLAGMAQQLGGTVKEGLALGSIGTNKDSYYYNASGGGFKAAGTQVFKTAEGAVQAALADALNDGAIVTSPAAQAALKKYGGDVNKAVAEAVKVQALEAMLADAANPFLAVFRDFETKAAERVKVATDTGFDLVAIEKLNAEQRTAVVQATLSQATGSVRQLLDDLKFGDRAEGSLGERRAALVAEQNRLAGLVRGGDASQLNGLSSVVQKLLDLDREAGGVAGNFAGSRASSIDLLNELVTQTEDRIKAASSAAQAAANGTADKTAAQLAEIAATGDDQYGVQQQILSELRNLNANFAGGAGGAAGITRSLDLSAFTRVL